MLVTVGRCCSLIVLRATRTFIIPRLLSCTRAGTTGIVRIKRASTREHDVLECYVQPGLCLHRRSVERSHSQVTIFLQNFCMRHEHDENVRGLRCRKPDAALGRGVPPKHDRHRTEGENRGSRDTIYTQVVIVSAHERRTIADGHAGRIFAHDLSTHI